MCLKHFNLKILFVIVFYSSLLATSSYCQDSLSRSAYESLHESYDEAVNFDSGITNAQVQKWITKFWSFRKDYPNTMGATRATVTAYQLAVKTKDIVALDTLFKQTSIHHDAMAEILNYLPYTPIYENAIPKLREIRRKSINSKVQASALLQSAKTHQNHRRYG